MLGLVVSGTSAVTSTPLQTDAVIVAGPLVHHRLANALFQIGELWMRAEPGTVFHRWMLSGAGRHATISVTTQPDRYADVPHVRIITGRLIHQTAPSASPVIHSLFVQGQETGRLGALTFQTTDKVIADAFDAWTDAEVSIVIRIRTE